MSAVENRWQAFRDEHNEYDPVVMYDITSWLCDDVLPSVFGENASEAALISAYEYLGIDTSEGSAISVLEDANLGEMEKIPMYRDLLALHAYAYFGLIDRENIIRSTYRDTYPEAANDIEAISIFLKLFDQKYSPEYPNPKGIFPKFICDKLAPDFRAARARLALDTIDGSQDIDPEDLAFLTGLQLRSIRNLMVGEPAILQANKENRIHAEHARRWLLTRKNFLWSLLDVPDIEQVTTHDRPSPDRLRNVLFVPVTKDGTWFSPDHHKEGVFSVGPRGNEEEFGDYLTALEALHHMDPPMWRRKADKKRWTVVMGIEWTRKTSSEIFRASSWLDHQIEPKKNGGNPYSPGSIRWNRIELLKQQSSSLSIREFNSLCRKSGLRPGAKKFFQSAVKNGCVRIRDGSGRDINGAEIV